MCMSVWKIFRTMVVDFPTADKKEKMWLHGVHLIENILGENENESPGELLYPKKKKIPTDLYYYVSIGEDIHCLRTCSLFIFLSL